MPTSAARVIYWFRTDLRLHDSPALHAALQCKPEALFPLWCWDPNYVYRHRVGLNRFRFLLESMQDTSDAITRTNPLSQLLVVRGDPALLLPELFKRWNITHLVFEKDVNGYSRTRDEEVMKLAEKAGVKVIAKHGHHLYDVEEVVKRHEGGKPITGLRGLESVISGMEAPQRPLDAPKEIPSPFLAGTKDKPKSLQDVQRSIHSSLQGLPTYHAQPGPPEVDLNSASLGGQRKPDGKVTCYDTVDGEPPKEEHFSVPTLASLGMDPASCGASNESVVKGGESEALKRLEKLCQDAAYVATFAKPKTSPSSDTTAPSTTLLSPFLKFGCISVRKMWYDCQDAIKKYNGGNKTGRPENLEGQLLFREMYACAEFAVGDAYQGIRGNRISRFMDWYLPNAFDKDGKPVEPRPRGDDVSEKRLEAFRAGQTGFPWIDAGIRQLRITGWCHHLMRHSLASFLTRGQCWISWERGAEIFEEWLLDWDPNANAGNWMWLSCSAFFSQFYRVYGLATFGQKFDKDGTLIRKYCPELKDMPNKFIFAPYTAPMDVQRKAKCIIGKDYPRPILDEKEEKQICLNRMKECYQAKLYGTSKEVLQGKATEMLRKRHKQPDPKPPKEDPGTNEKIPAWARAGHEAKTGTQESEEQGDDENDEIDAEEADRGEDDKTDDKEQESSKEEKKRETTDDGRKGNAKRAKKS